VIGPQSEQRLDFRDEIRGGEALLAIVARCAASPYSLRMLRSPAMDRGNETESNAEQFVQSAHLWLAISPFAMP
jgi:hypothetical protein